jgi:hypothetical protein
MPRATTPTMITPTRKQAILVEARRNRVAWVDESSSPYRVMDSCKGGSSEWMEKFLVESGEGLPLISRQNQHPRREASMTPEISESSTATPLMTTWDMQDNTSDEPVEDGLNLLRKSRVSKAMKSAVTIVSTLYSEIPASEVEERIARQMMSQLSTKDVQNILSSHSSSIWKKNKASLDATAMLRQNLPMIQKSISGYEVFIKRLRSPEAADLVQELKLFLSSLQTSIPKELKDPKEKQQHPKTQLASETSTSIYKFLDKLVHNLKSHVLWQAEEEEEFNLNCKVPLETFLFQKLYNTLWPLTCDEEGDCDIRNKIKSLQFISWEHLDIPNHLNKTSKETSSAASSSSDDPWSIAVEALQFVDAQWSPTAKLVLLVEAYRGITESITANKQRQEQQSVLPGADDSLPALILAILQARPENMISNLQYAQSMARPELLRGELGYVLTSVFSAIQFIMEIKDSSSLTISQEEFALGLSKCIEDNKKMRSGINSTDLTTTSTRGTDSVADGSLMALSLDKDVNAKPQLESKTTTKCAEITPRDVRMARTRGEIIDLNWARRHQAAIGSYDQPSVSFSDDITTEIDYDNSNITSQISQEVNNTITSMEYNSLPQGFSRTYSFLGVPPEDIRVSDIPLLLHEYNQLVRVCENLLSEKNAKLVAEHKRRLKTVRDQMKSDAAALDFPQI